jgi:hypothetical protein
VHERTTISNSVLPFLPKKPAIPPADGSTNISLAPGELYNSTTDKHDVSTYPGVPTGAITRWSLNYRQVITTNSPPSDFKVDNIKLRMNGKDGDTVTSSKYEKYSHTTTNENNRYVAQYAGCDKYGYTYTISADEYVFITRTDVRIGVGSEIESEYTLSSVGIFEYDQLKTSGDNSSIVVPVNIPSPQYLNVFQNRIDMGGGYSAYNAPGDDNKFGAFVNGFNGSAATLGPKVVIFFNFF